jgi:hypothetical protein
MVHLALNYPMNFPGIEVRYQILLMKAYLQGIWKGVEFASGEYLASELAKYDKNDPISSRHVYEIADVAFERFASQSFVVTIYALFETSLWGLLQYAHGKEGAGCPPKDTAGRTPIQKARRYMRKVLRWDYDFTAAEASMLSDLTKVRNCIAHANGNPLALTEGKLDELKVLESRKVGVYVNTFSLEVDRQFLECALSVVSLMLERLIAYMEKRYGYSFYIPGVPPTLN